MGFRAYIFYKLTIICASYTIHFSYILINSLYIYMMSVENYKKPVLREAVCQLVFSNENWSNSFVGKILSELQEDYPNFDTVTGSNIRLDVKEGGMLEQKLLPSIVSYKYCDKDNNNSITISENPSEKEVSFSFHTIQGKHYHYNWNNFLDEFLRVWEKIRQIINPEGINRIGMRYINHIPFKEKETPSKYLKKESEYIPSYILSQYLGFLSNTELYLSSGNKVKIILASITYQETNKKAILFDIDRMRQTQVKPNNEDIKKIAEELHLDIENIFFDSITENLKNQMRGEK